MSRRAAPSKLFHAIVVVGASMAEGCGGRVVLDSQAGTGSGGASPKPAGATTSHSASSASTAAVTTSTGAGCATVPVTSCASPAQYHCVDCGGGFANACACDASLPAKPSDCKTTADFHCTKWNPPTDCACVPGSPTSPGDCPPNTAWTCASFTPPVGCMCVVPIV